MPDLLVNKEIEIFNFIFKETLNKNRGIQFPATGSSMYPTLREGDILRVRRIKYHEARIGDILAYERPGSKKILVHRLVKKFEDSLLTLAESGPPRSYDLPLRPDNPIIGRVVAIERGKREIDLDTIWGRSCSRVRAYLLVKLPFVITTHRRCIKAVNDPALIPVKIVEYFKRKRRRQI